MNAISCEVRTTLSLSTDDLFPDQNHYDHYNSMDFTIGPPSLSIDTDILNPDINPNSSMYIPPVCKVLLISNDKQEKVTKETIAWLRDRSDLTVVTLKRDGLNALEEDQCDVLIMDLTTVRISLSDFIFMFNSCFPKDWLVDSWKEIDDLLSTKDNTLLLGYTSVHSCRPSSPTNLGVNDSHRLECRCDEYDDKITLDWVSKMSQLYPSIHFFIYNPLAAQSQLDLDLILQERIENANIYNLCDILDDNARLEKYHARKHQIPDKDETNLSPGKKSIRAIRKLLSKVILTQSESNSPNKIEREYEHKSDRIDHCRLNNTRVYNSPEKGIHRRSILGYLTSLNSSPEKPNHRKK